MSTITTHVLDTALGRPAVGVLVVLEHAEPGASPVQIGTGVTDADGRVRTLLPPGEGVENGDYRLRFATSAYFARDGRESFYPEVVVEFRVAGGSGHYHVPLLLSPYGYSTYRGS
jgi:5-hydroxyisourate hydrolase